MVKIDQIDPDCHSITNLCPDLECWNYKLKDSRLWIARIRILERPFYSTSIQLLIPWWPKKDRSDPLVSNMIELIHNQILVYFSALLLVKEFLFYGLPLVADIIELINNQI